MRAEADLVELGPENITVHALALKRGLALFGEPVGGCLGALRLMNVVSRFVEMSLMVATSRFVGMSLMVAISRFERWGGSGW